MPGRSIVLYVRQQMRDEQGKVLESQDVLKLIAAWARVPLYGMSFVNVGRGIVGGYVWTMEANATRLAGMTLYRLHPERGRRTSRSRMLRLHRCSTGINFNVGGLAKHGSAGD